MAFHVRLGRMVFVPIFCAAVLCAQQNPPSTPAATSHIELDVVVTPKSGPPVPDLQQQDFTILDNKAPQHVTSFRAFAGNQVPVQLIVVLDAVNLPYERVAYARGEIDKFLHANGGRLARPTSIAFFTDKGMQMEQGYSTDGNELSATVDHYAFALRDIRRSSQWEASDRFRLSLNALQSLVAAVANTPGRKMILWVSPGWPLLSGPRVYLDAKQQDQIFSEVVNLSTVLRQTHITLYAVNPIGAGESVGRTFYYQDFLKGVSKPGNVQVADLSLEVLAMQTGGLVLNGSNNIAGYLQQCMADADAYYELSFSPAVAEHRNEYHHLEVQVAKPGLIARTRDGYYAQP
jgi:VWFA-related protein